MVTFCVCDCLMFNTAYCWYLNISVDLGLACSNHPKLKGKPWEIYEHSDCDNDKTGMADLVEGIVGINNTLSHERVAKYKDQSVIHSPPRREQVQLVRTDDNYFYISLALSVVLLGLKAGAVYLLWCGVRLCTLRRSGRVHSDAETHRLSSSTN